MDEKKPTREQNKMRSSTQPQIRKMPSTAEDVGLGPKKTFLVLFTVVGCIAILFPKIFYPMIFDSPNNKMRGPPGLNKKNFMQFSSIIFL